MLSTWHPGHWNTEVWQIHWSCTVLSFPHQYCRPEGNSLKYIDGSQNFLGKLGPTVMETWLTPRNVLFPNCVTTPNTVLLGQTVRVQLWWVYSEADRQVLGITSWCWLTHKLSVDIEWRCVFVTAAVSIVSYMWLRSSLKLTDVSCWNNCTVKSVCSVLFEANRDISK